MSIKIAPIAPRPAFNELDNTQSQVIPIDMARMMVAEMGLTQDARGVFYQGAIWERVDDGANVLDYPASEIEIRVGDGRAILTMEGIYAPGLFSQWIAEQLRKPMIVQTFTQTGMMRSVG